jgi:glycosyltransferase involved in cell wall biosynthesis
VMIKPVIPDYRNDVVSGLAEMCSGDFALYCGQDAFEENMHSDITLGEHHRPIRNRYLLHRRLLWQHGTLVPGLRATNVMLELNPRILTVWLTLILRRLTGRRTALWGHAFPRGGVTARSERVRKLQRSLATALVPYTESEAESLRRIHPGKEVIAAPNGLYFSSVSGPLDTEEPGLSIIYSGRLHPPKKPMLLIEGFAEALPNLPTGAQLFVVGDGVLREQLEARVRDLGIADRVEFYGTVTDADRLRVLYSRCAVSVSPGFVGLSLIQTLWFGRPMVIADREPHAPEIEAAVDGVNAMFFEADNAHDLATKLTEAVKSATDGNERRQKIADDCRDNYSIEVMIERLHAALVGRAPAKSSVGDLEDGECSGGVAGAVM